MTDAPTAPGFYWAKWRICAEGTRDEAEFQPSDTWEVVDVFENCIDADDPEYLMVHVPGVEKGQPLDGFVWGAGIAPATKGLPFDPLEGEHAWVKFTNLPTCMWCGIVRRRDGNNKPCKGKVVIALRGPGASP